MKKLFLLLISVMSMTAYGQFTKGTRTLGFNFGGIGYNSRNTDEDYTDSRFGLRTKSQNDFSLSINPSYGVFLSNQLLLGGGLSVSYNRSKYEEKYDFVFNSSSNSLVMGLNVYSRYYFAGKNNLFPYGQINFGIGFGNGSGESTERYISRDSSIIEDFTQKGILNVNAGFSAGVTKMLNKSVGIDFSLGYNLNMFNSTISPTFSRVVRGSTTESGSGGEYKSSNITNGLGINVGLIIFLEPKK